jgi:hypothetical protein
MKALVTLISMPVWLASVTGSVPTEELLTMFPTEWIGIWGADAKKCSATNIGSDESLMKISGKKVEWHHSQCEIKAATLSYDSATMEFQFLCAGEEYEWVSFELWKRIEIENAEVLTLAIPNRNLILHYRRCD